MSINIGANIASAVLAEPDEGGFESAGPTLPLTGKGKEFAVVDSNVVTYRENVPDSVRNHVANWILMAQRMASHSVPDRADTEAWTAAYLDALIATGWVLRGEAGAWHRDSVDGAEMHQEILKVIAVALAPAPAALAIVTAAITSLQSMAKNSPWITLFNRRAESATAVGFQIADCQSPQSKGAALEAVDFRVEAGQVMTQVLWFKFTSGRAAMYRRRVVLDLSDETMKAHGAAVASKVQALTSANIAGAQLSDTP